MCSIWTTRTQGFLLPCARTNTAPEQRPGRRIIPPSPPKPRHRRLRATPASPTFSMWCCPGATRLMWSGPRRTAATSELSAGGGRDGGRSGGRLYHACQPCRPLSAVALASCPLNHKSACPPHLTCRPLPGVLVYFHSLTARCHPCRSYTNLKGAAPGLPQLRDPSNPFCFLPPFNHQSLCAFLSLTPRSYTSIEELCEDYRSGALHPGDLKPALAKHLNQILQVRGREGTAGAGDGGTASVVARYCRCGQRQQKGGNGASADTLEAL